MPGLRQQHRLVAQRGPARHERPAPEAVAVLRPGSRLPVVVARAIDLGLDATHRVVRLDPLFDGRPSAGTLVELRISRNEPLPGPLLGALDHDPRLLVTRIVDEHLLVHVQEWLDAHRLKQAARARAISTIAGRRAKSQPADAS